MYVGHICPTYMRPWFFRLPATGRMYAAPTKPNVTNPQGGPMCPPFPRFETNPPYPPLSGGYERALCAPSNGSRRGGPLWPPVSKMSTPVAVPHQDRHGGLSLRVKDNHGGMFFRRGRIYATRPVRTFRRACPVRPHRFASSVWKNGSFIRAGRNGLRFPRVRPYHRIEPLSATPWTEAPPSLSRRSPSRLMVRDSASRKRPPARYVSPLPVSVKPV